MRMYFGNKNEKFRVKQAARALEGADYQLLYSPLDQDWFVREPGYCDGLEAIYGPYPTPEDAVTDLDLENMGDVLDELDKLKGKSNV